MEELSAEEKEVEAKIQKRYDGYPKYTSIHLYRYGKDYSQNVEIEKFGEPVVPDFEIPNHTENMEKLHRNR